MHLARTRPSNQTADSQRQPVFPGQDGFGLREPIPRICRELQSAIDSRSPKSLPYRAVAQLPPEQCTSRRSSETTQAELGLQRASQRRPQK